MKNINEIIDIAEDLGWTAKYNEENGILSLQIWTPQSQDFNTDIDIKQGWFPDDAIASIYFYWESFDISKHTYLWLDETGHGKNGAPFDMLDVYNDFKWVSDRLYDLYEEIKNI